MATLRTRAAKGSELTTAELDGNFKRTVTQKTTTYACLISDNRSVIECNHATTAFTVTLGDAATMAAAETGDYEITITNIGAAVVTVARAGSDTIDGAATSLTLNQYSTVTLQITSGGDWKTISKVGDLGAVNTGALAVTGAITVSSTVDGRDIAADGTALDALPSMNVVLNTKVIDIGDWDMDATTTHTVAHGLTWSKIRTINVLIRNDVDTNTRAFPIPNSAASSVEQVVADSTDISLIRATSGTFDNTGYDTASSYNRGWITIQYTN